MPQQTPHAAQTPRLAPLDEAAWDDVLKGVVAVTGPLNIFTTLGRHSELFRAWIGLGSMMLLGGTLGPRIRELAILRVAHNSGCAYEWDHHVRIGRDAGLTEVEIGALAGDLDAHAWTSEDWAVVAAADELHATSTLSDAVWSALAKRLDERALIELVMLIGHYQMLAYALNALRVQPDAD
ncbi:carboxymuconolactone decarboxylase family protein [Thermomonospora umbrina]|uniref:AhpD family alkylhydroperoxidase n=1 Tax=Thermomonospora umbrina TaxID=111806 RepID=A0A3D9T2U1_9ACTN|nr:carboxymuconolactone decarboxylase family protein [Thermomonospora umbrina]REE99565.1 AhpD family alkylhydroperoxidase [Thermomonospora umbrina]